MFADLKTFSLNIDNELINNLVIGDDLFQLLILMINDLLQFELNLSGQTQFIWGFYIVLGYLKKNLLLIFWAWTFFKYFFSNDNPLSPISRMEFPHAKFLLVIFLIEKFWWIKGGSNASLWKKLYGMFSQLFYPTLLKDN